MSSPIPKDQAVAIVNSRWATTIHKPYKYFETRCQIRAYVGYVEPLEVALAEGHISHKPVRYCKRCWGFGVQ